MGYDNFMKPKDLITHFVSVEKAAAAIGVTVGAIYQWLAAGEVPAMRQSDIEVKTAYRLLSNFTKQRHKKDKKKNRRSSGTG